jgi:hypothetical protein
MESVVPEDLTNNYSKRMLFGVRCDAIRARPVIGDLMEAFHFSIVGGRVFKI